MPKAKSAKKTTKTPRAKLKDTRLWHHIDADGKILGRVATQVATVLRGKNKRDYSPHLNNGDFVVVTNAEKIVVTTKDKIYYTHSGYMGGLKETGIDTMRERHPERILEAAVKGMLPKNKLQAKFLKKLKIYKGSEHPHLAQKPKSLELRFNA